MFTDFPVGDLNDFAFAVKYVLNGLFHLFSNAQVIWTHISVQTVF